MTVIKFILILGLFVFFNACEKKFEWEKRYELSNENIDLPITMTPLNDFSKNLAITKNKNLLIGLFNCGCPTCARDLTKWEEVYKDLDKEKIIFLLIIFNDMDSYVGNIINNENLISYPIFNINNSDYFIDNITLHVYDNTILLENNEIKYIGNIINNTRHAREISLILDDL